MKERVPIKRLSHVWNVNFKIKKKSKLSVFQMHDIRAINQKLLSTLINTYIEIKKKILVWQSYHFLVGRVLEAVIFYHHSNLTHNFFTDNLRLLLAMQLLNYYGFIHSFFIIIFALRIPAKYKSRIARRMKSHIYVL